MSKIIVIIVKTMFVKKKDIRKYCPKNKTIKIKLGGIFIKK